MPADGREVVRRMARDDAGVPGRAPPAADRGPAPPEVRADRRLQSVLPRGSAARGELVGARPRTRPEARVLRRARRVPPGPPDGRAPRRARPRRQRHPHRRGRRRARGRPSTAASTRWTGDIPADGIAFVGRVELADAVDVEACSSTATPAGSSTAIRSSPSEQGRGRRRPQDADDSASAGEPGLDSVSRSHERPEPPRRGVSDGNDDDTATRCCPHSEGAAGRPGARPVLPIGGRQEVGHGHHRHHAHGVRPRPHDRQPQALPLEGGAEPLRRGPPRHPRPPAAAHGAAVDVPHRPDRAPSCSTSTRRRRSRS